jgi:hypothetical protein
MTSLIAFIDVLGFASYTDEDLKAAQLLLRHQQYILKQKRDEEITHPAAAQPDPGQARLLENHHVDSFSSVLPFSDSLFIVSEDRDKFLRQLAHFLSNSLGLVGHAFADPEDPAQPEKVTITDFPSGQKFEERWYPPLWRGGLALGECEFFMAMAVSGGKEITIPNLAGPAVVQAARLEKSGRGPRLFCAPDVKTHFGPDVQPFFREVSTSVSELLWPGLLYDRHGPPRIQMNDFTDLWLPAVQLWKARLRQPAFEHYDEFLRLLIRSLLCWAETVGIAAEARVFVQNRIQLDMGSSMIDAYLI